MKMKNLLEIGTPLVLKSSNDMQGYCCHILKTGAEAALTVVQDIGEEGSEG